MLIVQTARTKSWVTRPYAIHKEVAMKVNSERWNGMNLTLLVLITCFCKWKLRKENSIFIFKSIYSTLYLNTHIHTTATSGEEYIKTEATNPKLPTNIFLVRWLWKEKVEVSATPTNNKSAGTKRQPFTFCKLISRYINIYIGLYFDRSRWLIKNQLHLPFVWLKQTLSIWKQKRVPEIFPTH